MLSKVASRWRPGNTLAVGWRIRIEILIHAHHATSIETTLAPVCVAEPLVGALSSTLRADADSPPQGESVQSIVTTGRLIPGLVQYDRAMAGLIARWSIPGAALAIAKDGRL